MRVLPLEVVKDHLLVSIGSGRALIDTGSPRTIEPPAEALEFLGCDFRWLVGTDVLARRPFVIDWPSQLVHVGSAGKGQHVGIGVTAGVPVIEVEAKGMKNVAFLDTGAPISYVPAGILRDLPPFGRHTDFYPKVGLFTVTTYRLVMRVAGEELTVVAGGLPPMLSGLAASGNSPWILGIDFFRDRAVGLDLSKGKLTLC
jgi:hypothetical protein